ncbi:hypothetical protein BJ878DRAFT_456661 [Calycina marina]|uniref:Pentatricopeptide repeat protein n=1 Tax=Calycina marina TaxID=1763456 RepID=A0A9P8CGG7_9HELO|nr:hypothetical protein BJ878DRAFT_456661 [Calycina marina]
MLTCSSCMKRALQTLIGDSIVLPSNASRKLVTSSNGKRFYTLRNTGPTTAYERALAHKNPDKQKQRQEWLDSRGTRPSGKAQNKPFAAGPDQEFVVRKHLQYLKDPVKLADFVRRNLRDDNFDTTLEVVRSASKSIQCIVSWNHLIDYTLSKGKMNAAIKIYNEMKKRAQFPDGHTYTILFRGCAEHPDSKHAFDKVISIYRGMLLDRSKIKPSTIHVNAVLKMCARAGDIDSMVTIASEMPENGVGSPDNLTYTTLLNALRMDSVISLRDSSVELTPLQKKRNARKAILSGRYIWQDLTERWAKGYLWIDEELICSMGRLLAVGEPRDKDDIFSLIEQTMNIPRQIGRIINAHQDEPLEETDTGDEVAPRLDIDGSDGTSEGFPIDIDPFKNVPSRLSSPKTGLYAKPGRNALSLLLAALLNSRRGHPGSVKEPATKYWDIITKEVGVIPDRENYHAFLRILRASRSSTDAVELLATVPLKDMDHSTFRIAISCCQRDKRNHNAFANAGKIMDYMQQAMNVPDVQVCEAYLDTVVSYTAGGLPTISTPRTATANAVVRAAQGKQILRALERLHPHFVNLRSLLAYGDKERSITHKNNDAALREAVVGLTKRMVSALDILIHQSLVPDSLIPELREKRAKFNAIVAQYSKTLGRIKVHNDELYKRSEIPLPPAPASENQAFSTI